MAWSAPTLSRPGRRGDGRAHAARGARPVHGVAATGPGMTADAPIVARDPVRRILWARGLRDFGDGLAAVLLPEAWCMDRPVSAGKLSGVGGRPLS